MPVPANANKRALELQKLMHPDPENMENGTIPEALAFSEAKSPFFLVCFTFSLLSPHSEKKGCARYGSTAVSRQLYRGGWQMACRCRTGLLCPPAVDAVILPSAATGGGMGVAGGSALVGRKGAGAVGRRRWSESRGFGSEAECGLSLEWSGVDGRSVSLRFGRDFLKPVQGVKGRKH